jgi:hypothetical protein
MGYEKNDDGLFDPQDQESVHEDLTVDEVETQEKTEIRRESTRVETESDAYQKYVYALERFKQKKADWEARVQEVKINIEEWDESLEDAWGVFIEQCDGSCPLCSGEIDSADINFEPYGRTYVHGCDWYELPEGKEAEEHAFKISPPEGEEETDPIGIVTFSVQFNDRRDEESGAYAQWHAEKNRPELPETLREPLGLRFWRDNVVYRTLEGKETNDRMSAFFVDVGSAGDIDNRRVFIPDLTEDDRKSHELEEWDKTFYISGRDVVEVDREEAEIEDGWLVVNNEKVLEESNVTFVKDGKIVCRAGDAKELTDQEREGDRNERRERTMSRVRSSCAALERQFESARKGYENLPEFTLEPDKAVIIFRGMETSYSPPTDRLSRDGLSTRSSGGGSSTVPVYDIFVPREGTDLYFDLDDLEESINGLKKSERAKILPNIEKFAFVADDLETFKAIERSRAVGVFYDHGSKVNTVDYDFNWPKEKSPYSCDPSLVIEERELHVRFFDGSEETLSKDDQQAVRETMPDLPRITTDAMRKLIAQEGKEHKEQEMVDVKDQLRSMGFTDQDFEGLTFEELSGFLKG